MRAAAIRRAQRKFLKTRGPGSASQIIIFLVPGLDTVNGGILSIIALARETEELMPEGDVEVFVAPVPGEAPLLRFTKFQNDRSLVDFRLVLSRARAGARVLCNIPEVYLVSFLEHGTEMIQRAEGLRFSFNIMLQNIDLAPTRQEVAQLQKLGPVTCSTAHRAYANSRTEELFGVPVHHWSVWVSPEKYERREFSKKRNLIVISPDDHPSRSEILGHLKHQLSDYEFRVIRELTYEQYKGLIAEAKFSLTFGEGLDGYFAEEVFSGGIGCAVYNSRFFTPDFRSAPFVYESWDDLVDRLPGDVRRCDTQSEFTRVQAQQFNLLEAQYGHERHIENLRSYYEKYFPIEVPD